METAIMKGVRERTYNGVTETKSFTTVTGNQGQFVIQIVGIGKPYWLWQTMPAGKVIGADYTGAPIVDPDPAVNNANIAAITALPEDVVYFE